MRFKISINFDFSAFGNKLPANYQYELSAWIYHTLAKGDAEYTEWLHQNGYTNDKKQFRMFTFSHLQISKLRMEGDRMVLQSNQACFYLSFLPERATEEFIKGVFTSQTFDLGDRVSKVQCSIQGVELVAPPVFEETMIFQTISPMVISGRLENGHVTYLSPEEPNTALLLSETLRAKFLAYYGKPFEDFFEPEFKLMSPVKRKKITIKAGTLQQTYIVGYMARFSLRLPVELMKLVYETGVGEKGSMGFGMVELRSFYNIKT